MTESVIPDFYESISQEDIHSEVGEPVVRPHVYNPDIFPFPSLGGQRFEILSYLLLRSDPQFEDFSITLVKVSGDRGRDLLIHRGGRLVTIIQCKNYGKPLDKSALLHELVKIALHNYRAPYINEDLLEYQIWATTGFTDPAEELINTWAVKNWSESDLCKAFELCRKKYAAFNDLTWDKCKQYLEQQFPKKISITKVDGIVLTNWLRRNSSLLEQFFTVQLVMSKNDTEKFLNNSGLRHVPETDISLILDSLRAFPGESRHYIGSFVMGLTPQHYALMTQDELRDFSLNCNRATISNASIVIVAITRYAAEKSHAAFS